MEPEDLFQRKYRRNTAWFIPTFTKLVFELFQQLHDLKMSTDEPEIAQKCQELLNLLFKKYPKLVPTPETEQR